LPRLGEQKGFVFRKINVTKTEKNWLMVISQGCGYRLKLFPSSFCGFFDWISGGTGQSLSVYAGSLFNLNKLCMTEALSLSFFEMRTVSNFFNCGKIEI
jgi:hypothetical protein